MDLSSLSNLIPGKRVPLLLKAIIFMSMLLLLGGILLLANDVTLEQVFGDHYTLLISLGIYPHMVGGIMVMLYAIGSYYVFYRMLYPKPKRQRNPKTIAEIRSAFRTLLRLILVIVGLVNVYVFTTGGPAATFYIGGASVGVGALFDQIIHAFASASGAFNNFIAMIRG